MVATRFFWLGVPDFLFDLQYNSVYLALLRCSPIVSDIMKIKYTYRSYRTFNRAATDKQPIIRRRTTRVQRITAPIITDWSVSQLTSAHDHVTSVITSAATAMAGGRHTQTSRDTTYSIDRRSVATAPAVGITHGAQQQMRAASIWQPT